MKRTVMVGFCPGGVWIGQLVRRAGAVHLDERFVEKVSDAAPNGARAVVFLSRSQVLLLPAETSPASLPPAFRDAHCAPVPGDEKRTALVSKVQWNRCVLQLEAMGLSVTGGIYVSSSAGNAVAAFADAARRWAESPWPWLVPPPAPWWQRVAPQRLEQAVAAAAVFFLIGGTIAARSADALATRVATENQKARAVARVADARSGENPLAFVGALSSLLPPRTHLLDFSFDGATHRARLRGRAADLTTVADIEHRVAAHPGVAHCRTEKSTVVRLEGTPVVEFSSEVTFR